MTTPSTVRKAGPFIGDGSQTTWPFEFKVFVEADIAVVIADVEGNETALVLNSDYTVEINDNQETSPGGTVTYPLPPGPGDDPVPNLVAGGRLSIVGNVPFDQLLDIPTGGNFNPIALENQLDRTTMQVQQLAEEFSRTVRVPVTYDIDDLLDFTGDVIRLADSADNIDILAANVDDIGTVADDLNLEVSNVVTVAQNIDDVIETSGGLPEISLVAADLAGTGYDYDLGSITVPSTGIGTSPASAIITVASNIEDVQAVAANEANINAVVANEANIDIVAGIDDDVTTVATNIADVQTVAANIDDVNTVAANIASVNTVAGIDADVSTVAGIASDVPEVAANEANINVVAGISADVTTVAGIESEVTIVVDNLAAILDAPTQAANASASATAASGSASAAAASASAAAAVIASGMYSAVQDKSADYTVVEADAGDLIRVTTTGGSRTITLPAISSVGEGFKVSVAKWTNDTNTVMVVRSGSDTINGQVDYLLLNQYGSATFVADAETSQWFAAGSGVSTGSVVVDRFSGNGSTTEFTLSGDPASENNTQVFVGGVYQQKDTYSLSGTALTFGSAPPSGVDNVEVVWTQPVAIGVPSDATVTAPKIADGAVVAHLGYTPANQATTNAALALKADQGTTYTIAEVDTGLGLKLNASNPDYTGTLTGGTDVVNLGSGQFYKDASGNIGIGTSSPSTKLHVFGENSGTRFENNTSKSLATFVAVNNSADAWNSTSNTAALFESSNNALAVLVGGTLNNRTAALQVGHAETLFAASLGTLALNPFGGNVGIGTATPATTLDVNGQISGKFADVGTNTTAMNLAANHVAQVTISAAVTLTTTVPPAGTTAYVILISSGTTARTVTFGTGFKTTATLSTGTVTARRFVLTFISDGENLVEASRTAAVVY
jgi:hypothetical protein